MKVTYTPGSVLTCVIDLSPWLLSWSDFAASLAEGTEGAGDSTENPTRFPRSGGNQWYAF
jgi:hypothetical protein